MLIRSPNYTIAYSQPFALTAYGRMNTAGHVNCFNAKKKQAEFTEQTTIHVSFATDIVYLDLAAALRICKP